MLFKLLRFSSYCTAGYSSTKQRESLSRVLVQCDPLLLSDFHHLGLAADGL